MRFLHPSCLMALTASSLFCFSGCVGAPTSDARERAEVKVDGLDTLASGATVPQDARLELRVIDAADGTFGYDILLNGTPYIHQLSIPGQPGNRGCATRADAEKLATLVIQKIRAGEVPPTVNDKDLEQLGIVP